MAQVNENRVGEVKVSLNIGGIPLDLMAKPEDEQFLRRGACDIRDEIERLSKENKESEAYLFLAAAALKRATCAAKLEEEFKRLARLSERLDEFIE